MLPSLVPMAIYSLRNYHDQYGIINALFFFHATDIMIVEHRNSSTVCHFLTAIKF